MNNKIQKMSGAFREAWLAVGGAFTGFAALIGASCCVLPIVLVNLGVSTALVSNLAFFVRAKPYFMGLTIALIVVGIVAAFWRGRRPNLRVVALLGFATLFAAGAFIMPYYERELLQWVNLR